MRIGCDVIMKPYNGVRVCAAFADARILASLLGYNVTVEGNGVSVVVSPQMTEAQCRRAYEDALEETGQ